MATALRFEESDLHAPFFAAGQSRCFYLRATGKLRDPALAKIGQCRIIEGKSFWMLITRAANSKRQGYRTFANVDEAQAAGLAWARETLGIAGRGK